MKRIAVVGTSGSGKSTLAEILSKTLSIPHTQLDALYWLPNWSHVSDDELRRRVDDETSKESWVICGNFSQVRDLSWSRADTVIWLDYSFPTVFSRLLKRSILRSFDRKDLWGTGNTESFRQNFMSKDSIILWMLKTYWPHKKRYAELIKNSEYDQLKFIRLKNQKETEALVLSLGAKRT